VVYEVPIRSTLPPIRKRATTDMGRAKTRLRSKLRRGQNVRCDKPKLRARRSLRRRPRRGERVAARMFIRGGFEPSPRCCYTHAWLKPGATLPDMSPYVGRAEVFALPSQGRFSLIIRDLTTSGKVSRPSIQRTKNLRHLRIMIHTRPR
jgi:hypothetical protein